MRKVVVLLVVVFAIGLVLAAALGQFLLVSQHIASVSNVAGSVLVRAPRALEFVPLADASRVLAGTVLKTGTDGAATLNWIDGTRLQVKGDTIITVLRCQINRANRNAVSQFKLDTGEIMVRVRKLLTGQSKFEIKTPTATAGVRGTVFTVKVQPDGRTEVVVLEGQVDVTTPTGTAPVAGGKSALTGAEGTQVQAATDLDRVRQAAGDVLGPAVEVYVPVAGMAVTPGQLVVQGGTEKGASVQVNGQSARVNKLGRFFATVSVPAGAKHFTLLLEARDGEGHLTRITRALPVTAAAD